MSEKYPNPCCRCGFCCLIENCKVAIKLFGVEKRGERCPALSFDESNKAACSLVKSLPQDKLQEFGIGVGCCILARCYKGNVEHNFADLDPAFKYALAERIRK